MLFGRIINKAVDPAELAQCLIDNLGTEFLVADVAIEKQTFATMLFDELLGFFRVSVLFEIDDADVRAFFGEGNRDCAADTAVATGDDCDFAPQFAASALAFILRPGARLHFVLAPRMLALMLRRLALFLVRHGESLSISAHLPAVMIFFAENSPPQG